LPILSRRGRSVIGAAVHPGVADGVGGSMDAVIGTAGWSIARTAADAFPAEGTTLERYSTVFRGVEINSSFHRPHRASTWSNWAQSVPDGFRFAVKIPKTITHQAKLAGCEELVSKFAEEVRPLGGKLALLLVQLPPKLGFEREKAERFFARLREAIDAEIVCEPRNPSWFEDEADSLLDRLRVARVAADPSLSPAAAVPGGWRGLAYWRLHGSPAMYRSSYGEDALDGYARRIAAAIGEGREAWCMFDNTAASEATGNALSLMMKVRGGHILPMTAPMAAIRSTSR
jgi:uncharacterized protein YecE (DUF72 family)